MSRARSGSGGGAPLFSIVTPVFDPPIEVLEATIASVLAQEHRDWEWILVDDASTDPHVVGTITRHMLADDRVRLLERDVNGHIVAASNDGIDAARGEFVVLLDHDDLLTPDALEVSARWIAEHDDVDYLYSDEDKVDDRGHTYGRFAKPDWSPERLRGQMYTSHLSVIRTSVVRAVGGFREGYDGSQDHDLALRVGEVARRVVHVPEVLYHWRAVAGSASAAIDAKPYATVAGQRAVQDHLDRTGVRARVEQGAEPGRYVIHRDLDPGLRVSVVIPTLGQSDIVFGQRRVMVVEAVRSLLARTEHQDVEVVVVHDAPTPPEVLAQLREVAGDRLVLLNDDVEVISERWLENLVAPLDDPRVGMTGAKLYFADSTVQHACHAYWGTHYRHPFRFWTREEAGPFGELVVNREVSGVTAACAAMTRETYFEVAGFTETLPANFNDVDLCYKVRHVGRSIVWVANCELFHFESRTREGRAEAWERYAVVRRWGIPEEDPFTPSAVASPMIDPHRILRERIREADPGLRGTDAAPQP